MDEGKTRIKLIISHEGFPLAGESVVIVTLPNLGCVWCGVGVTAGEGDIFISATTIVKYGR